MGGFNWSAIEYMYLRRNIHTALMYTSKCIEAVPAEHRTRVAGVPTRRTLTIGSNLPG
jgi:hypothetical protein